MVNQTTGAAHFLAWITRVRNTKGGAKR